MSERMSERVRLESYLYRKRRDINSLYYIIIRAHEMKFLMFFHANNTHNDCIRCVFSILTKIGIITVLTVKTLEDCEK